MRRAIKYLFICLCLAPLLFGVIYSLGYSLGLAGLLSDGFTWDYWIGLINSGNLMRSTIYTIGLGACSLIIAVMAALVVSWKSGRYGVDHRSSISKSKAEVLILLPLLFAPVTAAFCWYQILSPGGFIARASFHLGLIHETSEFPRLVNDDLGIGIVICHVFLILPVFSYLFTATAHKHRLHRLYLQSNTLGASSWYFFKKVYTPMLLQKNMRVLWLYLIFLLGTYEVPLLLGGSRSQTFSVFIADKLTRFNLGDIPSGYCMAIWYTVLITVMTALYLRWQKSILW